jgi:tRNA-binding EMAP/Myf-like protein
MAQHCERVQQLKSLDSLTIDIGKRKKKKEEADLVNS